MAKSKTSKTTSAQRRKSKRTNPDDVSPDESKRTKSVRRVSAENEESQAVSVTDSPPSRADKIEADWWKMHDGKVRMLINKCMKDLDWDKPTATRVLTSYRQFLVVKKEAKDWSQEPKLKPCWAVGLMWNQHCYMEDYIVDTETLCGHVVHRPKNSIFVGDENATVAAIRRRFGTEFDEWLWTNIKLSFQDQLGDKKVYEVNLLQDISCLFSSYISYYASSYVWADSQTYIEEDFRFVYEDKDIQEYDTPISLGMTTSDSILAIDSADEIIIKIIHKHMTKFSIMHSSADVIADFLIKDDFPLLHSFDEFVSKHLENVSRKDLVFSFNGRRLYTFDSVRTLKIIENDVIVATPVKDYNTEGCACCQKKQNSLRPYQMLKR